MLAKNVMIPIQLTMMDEVQIEQLKITIYELEGQRHFMILDLFVQEEHHLI